MHIAKSATLDVFELIATTVSFFERQGIGPLAIIKIYPLIDLHSRHSQFQSKSKLTFNFLFPF